MKSTDDSKPGEQTTHHVVTLMDSPNQEQFTVSHSQRTMTTTMSDYRILCFGDSNTWGAIPLSDERYSRNVRWTGVMAELLGPAFTVIEEGQCGRTTVMEDPMAAHKNGLRYLPACLESHQPLDLVILMLGTNDLKARFSLTPDDIALGTERLIQEIRRAEQCAGRALAILLAAPPPVNPQGALEEMFQGGIGKSESLSTRYANLAERTGCAFLDVGSIIAADPADGLHFSAQAHVQLGKAMAQRVRSMCGGSGYSGSRTS